MKVERYHLFAIGLAVFLSVLFYSIMGMRREPDWENTVFRGHPSAPAVPPADFAEFDNEIEQLTEALDSGRGDRRTFEEMAARVEGGSDWLLLRMAAVRNRDRVYVVPGQPELTIALEAINPGKGRAVFRLQITNPGTTLLAVPRVPASVLWKFSGPDGRQRQISADLPRAATSPDIIRLDGRTFWGVLLDVDVTSLEQGTWDAAVELTYSETDTAGHRLVTGVFISNSVAIVL